MKVSNILQIIKRACKFLYRSSVDEKIVVVQVLVVLGISRLVINNVRWSRLERWLGTRMKETPMNVPAAHEQYMNRIKWAIKRVSPKLPWRSDCFPEALTAKYLLKRKRIASTLYIGAAFKPGEKALQGHIWLRCGNTYIGGRESKNQFGAVACFG